MKILKWTLSALGLVVGGGIVAFAIVAGTGLASAQTPEPTPAEEELTRKMGLSYEELKALRDDRIDEAVANGTLTPEEGERLKNADLGEHRGLGRRAFHAVRNIFGAAADVIGISKEDLKTERMDGKSLAEIAAEHNVSRDDLEAGIIAAIQAKIDEALANGRITEEQAARLSNSLGEHLDQVLDNTEPPLKRLREFREHRFQR